MNKGYITFNRKGIIEEDCIELQLKDEKSKNRFMEVHIPLDEFMRALTGVSERPMEYEVNYKVLETLGKQRIVQRVNMDLPTDEFIHDIKRLVAEDFAKRGFMERGWTLKDYGNNSIQDNRVIDGHRIWTYKIERYADESETVE